MQSLKGLMFQFCKRRSIQERHGDDGFYDRSVNSPELQA